MAITSLAGYNSAHKQSINWINTGTYTVVAQTWFSMFRGTLAGANTANGVVPTITDWDSSIIVRDKAKPDSFAGGATGYLTRAVLRDGQSGIVKLSDLLFKAGAYSFDSNVTLTSQPSYASRLPNSDYTNTELWLETSAAFTGNVTITVTYTNESGVTGRTTNLTSYTALAPTARRMLRFPLQSGDTGIQTIESVVSTTATVGTFNLLVLRPLVIIRSQGRVTHGSCEQNQTKDMIKLGMPQIKDDMCPHIMIMPDATPSATDAFFLEITSG